MVIKKTKKERLLHKCIELLHIYNEHVESHKDVYNVIDIDFINEKYTEKEFKTLIEELEIACRTMLLLERKRFNLINS